MSGGQLSPGVAGGAVWPGTGYEEDSCVENQNIHNGELGGAKREDSWAAGRDKFGSATFNRGELLASASVGGPRDLNACSKMRGQLHPSQRFFQRHFWNPQIYRYMHAFENGERSGLNKADGHHRRNMED